MFNSPCDGVLVAPRHCGLLATPDLLRQVQSSAEAPGAHHLLLDLSRVEVLVPAAFRALVWARRYCKDRGVTLELVPPSKGTVRPQEMVVLRLLFPCRDAPATSTS